MQKKRSVQTRITASFLSGAQPQPHAGCGLLTYEVM